MYYFSVVTTVVVSVVLHELGHGVAALWQGDPTPRATGHMTLDPMVHMGGVSLALLFVVGIAFGQMPVNPSRFRSRFGRAFVAFAGPLVNLLLASVALTGLGLWLRFADQPLDTSTFDNGQFFLYIFGAINVLLCLFNLVPIPPLDGATVLADVSGPYRRLARNPHNRGLFLGLFVVVFVFADKLIVLSRDVSLAYLSLLHG